MLDTELLDSIRSALSGFGSASELPEEAASRMIDEVAQRHITDPHRTWWWTAVKGDSKTIPYGENDGLEEVSRLLPRDAAAFLVITDDEPPPWPAFRGALSDLLGILRSVRFCEYFIADTDCKWVVFDTHDNSLVIAGDLPHGAGPSALN